MQKVKTKLSLIAPTVFMVLTLLTTSVAFSSAVNAADEPDGTCTSGGSDSLSLSNGVNCAKGDDQDGNLFGAGGIFRTITNALLFLIGAISVIMLVYGGFRYATSGGNQESVNAAKNTILYAIVGLVVAILGFAIVQWVVGALNTSE